MNSSNIIKQYNDLGVLHNEISEKSNNYEDDTVSKKQLISDYDQLRIDITQALDIIINLEPLRLAENHKDKAKKDKIKPMDQDRKDTILNRLEQRYKTLIKSIDSDSDSDSDSEDSEIFQSYIDLLNKVADIIMQFKQEFSKLQIISFKDYDLAYLESLIMGFSQTFMTQYQIRVKPEDINFLKIFDSDRHFVDSFPVFSFSINETKFILKPRRAKIDCAIMKLFKKINKVNKRQLATFHITPHPDSSIIASLWEFINTTGIEQTAYNFLCNANLSLADLNERKNNLIFLNTVAHRIGLTDLHRENVLLDGNLFYPIDLESINDESVTGLYDHKLGPIGRLNRKTIGLINKFNDGVDNIPYRFVGIPTAALLNYNNVGSDQSPSMTELLEMFQENIAPFNLKLDSDKLVEYINKCRDHQIVPYFYKWKNNIYIKDIHINGPDTKITSQ